MLEECEEVRKLLDNGWRVVLFRDGLGQYSALAVRCGRHLDAAMEEWEEYEPGGGTPSTEWPFDGPNRYCGCGLSVAGALKAVTEKVLLRRLP